MPLITFKNVKFPSEEFIVPNTSLFASSNFTVTAGIKLLPSFTVPEMETTWFETCTLYVLLTPNSPVGISIDAGKNENVFLVYAMLYPK